MLKVLKAFHFPSTETGTPVFGVVLTGSVSGRSCIFAFHFRAPQIQIRRLKVPACCAVPDSPPISKFNQFMFRKENSIMKNYTCNYFNMYGHFWGPDAPSYTPVKLKKQ